MTEGRRSFQVWEPCWGMQARGQGAQHPHISVAYAINHKKINTTSEICLCSRNVDTFSRSPMSQSDPLAKPLSFTDDDDDVCVCYPQN